MVVRWFRDNYRAKRDDHHDRREVAPALAEIKSLLSADKDFLKPLVRTALEDVLEAKMTEALGAAKGDRVEGRLGYRSELLQPLADDAHSQNRARNPAGPSGAVLDPAV